ncbi:MAG: response regulator [Myxococcales bacterium]|nr:response regulator [Myxococcales bacterium]
MKVLIVDDEADIRRIGELSLQSVAGWQVLLAESGVEGVEAAKVHRPDLILMDMMMPEMDGLTALKQLRKNPELESTPVVFMTAKVHREEISRYLEAGAAGVVHKPFDPMTLPDEIRRILND